MFWEKYELLCKRNGKSPNTVGKEIGVSSGSISWWKKGKVPHAPTLRKIADYFGVSVKYLLGQTDEKQDKEKTPSYEEGSNAMFLDSDKIRMIPLVESVSAGFGAYPDERIIDFIIHNILYLYRAFTPIYCAKNEVVTF